MAQEKSKKDLGKSFLDRVLEKLPQDRRQAAADALLASEEVLELVGEGVLTKEEGSRVTQRAQAEIAATTAHKANLDDWWKKVGPKYNELLAKEQAGTLGQGEERGEGGGGEGTPAPKAAPAALPANAVTREELQAAMNGGLIDVAHLTTLAGKHYAEFGEPLDGPALIAHCTQIGIPAVRGGYDSFVKERRAVREDQARKKEIEEAEKRGAEKERERLAREQSAPPDSAGALSASFAQGTLRSLGLKPEERDAQFGTDAAVRGFYKRRQEKAG